MAKIIRKARNQIHSVREDGLRRQLHAVRNDSKHSRRTISSSHNAPTPGFKFSDIDNDDTDGFDWMGETDSNTKNSSSTTTRSSEPQTSDYYSSYSPESSYSSRDHTQSDTSDSKDHQEITTIDDSLFDSKHSTSTTDNTKHVDRSKVSSLFNDLPDLEEDHFDNIIQDDAHLHDPLGLNQYSTSPSLFDDVPLSKEKCKDVVDPLTGASSDVDLFDDHSSENADPSNKTSSDGTNVKQDNESRLTDLVNSLFGNKESNDENVTLEQSVNKGQGSLDTPDADDQGSYMSNGAHNAPLNINESNTVVPLATPIDSIEQGSNELKGDDKHGLPENSSKDDDDDNDLFASATNKLMSSVNDYNLPKKTQSEPTSIGTSIESSLTLSEVSEDPLSMMDPDDSIYGNYQDSEDVKVPDPAAANNRSLLLISEDHYADNYSLNHLPKQLPDSVMTFSHTKQPSNDPLASTPPRSSPTFLPKSKISPRTQMRLNRSGKEVPIIPPRPSLSQRTMSAPDPDAVSIISNMSSISAYSADEIFNRNNSTISSDVSSLSSYASDYTVKSDPGNYQPLDRINESPFVSGDAPSDQSHQSADNDYTIIILSLVWLLLYLYYSLNPFVYLAGFLAGFLVFYITIGSAFYWYVQHSEKERERRQAATRKVELPTIEDLPKTINTDFESSRILESKKFGMVFQYYPATHHPSQRVSAKVKLYNDYMLEIRYRRAIQTNEGLVNKEIKIVKNLRSCSILIVPEEVAQNRKRRWSKKFPLNISWDKEDGGTNSQIFLFPYTSREKEDWFRRMRSAQEGKLYDDIVREQKIFFRYMGKYMPHALSPQPEPTTHHARPHMPRRTEPKTTGHRSRSGNHKHSSKLATEPVRFSMASDNNIVDDDYDTSVKLSTDDKETANQQTVDEREKARTVPKPAPSPSVTPSPSVSSSLTYGWINAGLARLAWDLWHEERWKKWVQSRVQRKLIRIKTPSFMEPLKVTAIDMGMDMPVIKRPFKAPKLDSRGIWIYMEVDYKGTFNMTIETKLKLEPKALSTSIMHFNRGSESPPTSLSSSPTPSMMDHVGSSKPHPHLRSRRLRVNTGDPDDELSSGSDDEEGMSGHLTRSLEEKLPMELEQQGIPIYSAQDDSGFSTSSSSSSVTSSNEFDSTSGPKGRKEKILTNMVSRLQKFATKSKFVARAAEKVSSYPMTLSVEVKSLSGFLVLNMAPPPSDALWFGFTVNPVLDLVAKPKLGQREVTLSYVTDWIEKKLCDVVEKKLVFPNMEDLVIPVLSSGLPEDKLTDLITSPS